MDDTLCGTIKHKTGTNPYIIECATQIAREVTIVGTHQSGILTLCEVQVFFHNNELEDGKYRKTYSIAPHKTHVQNKYWY